MDISVLISLQCAKKSPKKSEHGKYLKIGEIQDGRQPNSRNMKIVIIIALILLHSCVIYLFVLAFQATCGGNSLKTVKSRKKTKWPPYMSENAEFWHGCLFRDGCSFKTVTKKQNSHISCGKLYIYL